MTPYTEKIAKSSCIKVIFPTKINTNYVQGVTLTKHEIIYYTILYYKFKTPRYVYYILDVTLYRLRFGNHAEYT